MNQREKLKQLRADIIARDKRTCQYCGKPKLSGTQLNIDHIVPECEGGLFVESNLVVACKQCNHRKGKKSVEEYAKHRLATLERERTTLEKILAEINSRTGEPLT